MGFNFYSSSAHLVFIFIFFLPELLLHRHILSSFLLHVFLRCIVKCFITSGLFVAVVVVAAFYERRKVHSNETLYIFFSVFFLCFLFFFFFLLRCPQWIGERVGAMTMNCFLCVLYEWKKKVYGKDDTH